MYFLEGLDVGTGLLRDPTCHLVMQQPPTLDPPRPRRG